MNGNINQTNKLSSATLHITSYNYYIDILFNIFVKFQRIVRFSSKSVIMIVLLIHRLCIHSSFGQKLTVLKFKWTLNSTYT